MKTIVEILMIFLHLFRFPTFIAMLTMNSVFLSMMKAHNIPVNKNIVITEVFAAVGAVVDILGLHKSCEVLGSDLYLSNLSLLCAGVVLRVVELFIMGCCIFIAVVYKAGAGACDSYADTPFGDIKGEDGLTGVVTSCRMQAATFAVAIIAV
ncbi:hypothetical protein E5D57_008377 [Metarhizium anisopliae]|nr:hypothetical protein E5D57_008377 [Metarhizium anisopliae]